MEFKIETIKGIGLKTKEVLNNNMIFTTNDLLLNYPSKYLHFTEHQNLSFKNHNEVVSIFTKVISDVVINTFTKTKIIQFEVTLNNQSVNVIAFNQSYLVKAIKKGDDIYIIGKYNYYKNEITLNKTSTFDNFQTIKPEYKIDSISNTNLSKIINNILTNNKYNIKENIPLKIIEKYSLNSKIDTIKELHNPTSQSHLNSAIKRIKYEEAYFFQLEMLKRINVKTNQKPINYNLDKVKKLINNLPFELTSDQKRVVNEIFKDFKLNETTYRLIQGDVGSGKTVVAMLAIYGILTAGKQVALMAPTEILAKQHFDSIASYFKDEFESMLLTSSTKNKTKIKEDIFNNKIRFVVGTQALVEDDVKFNELALIIIDEQHKFGVNTRNALLKKGNANLLYLTATPIPRTLAISMFGDAKISLIKEKPKNRIPIKTKYLLEDDIMIAINHLKEIIKKNEKAYLVVPAITSTHAKYNVDNVYLAVKKHLKGYNNIYKMHGKLKKEEQDEIISKFINDDSSILISTSMIEVGIDVKNATLIIIFSANYFGLSQLHQLRGRVGRSSLASTCYLISDKADEERLSIIEKVDDGFALSEYDLNLRGPGALLGLEQSGYFNFKYLDFINDYDILVNIRDDIINESKM